MVDIQLTDGNVFKMLPSLALRTLNDEPGVTSGSNSSTDYSFPNYRGRSGFISSKFTGLELLLLDLVSPSKKRTIPDEGIGEADNLESEGKGRRLG